jgi:hypothetical protein
VIINIGRVTRPENRLVSRLSGRPQRPNGTKNKRMSSEYSLPMKCKSVSRWSVLALARLLWLLLVKDYLGEHSPTLSTELKKYICLELIKLANVA